MENKDCILEILEVIIRRNIYVFQNMKGREKKTHKPHTANAQVHTQWKDTGNTKKSNRQKKSQICRS